MNKANPPSPPPNPPLNPNISVHPVPPIPPESATRFTRRTMLIGATASGGIAIAWSLWPRSYLPNLATNKGEQVFNAFLKITPSGQVTIIVPQCEMGQGITTLIPQIIADELGADWRTIAVESAPLNPLYRNHIIAAKEYFLPNDALADIIDNARPSPDIAKLMMITAASSSVRNFERPCRIAAAQARMLLMMAAAEIWRIPWQNCDTSDGFVTFKEKRLRFADLARDAARLPVPKTLSFRPPTVVSDTDKRLYGDSLIRLDLPSKSDGSVNYAGDVRLPGMVYAAIRQGPVGATKLKSLDRDVGMESSGLLFLVEEEDWFATVASNWWAANQALDRFAPVFETTNVTVSSDAIWRTLSQALASDGIQIASRGNINSLRASLSPITVDYGVAPALHSAIETRSATAHIDDGRLHIWVATQAPAFCQSAIAAATEWDEDKITLYPMQAGGSFGAALDHSPAIQAAIIARKVNKPVQLCWSRAEDIMRDLPRAPAHAQVTGYRNRNGALVGLETRIATPAASHELRARLYGYAKPDVAQRSARGKSDRGAVNGAQGAGGAGYDIDNLTLIHCPADIGLPVGRWRGNADSYTAFFTESFLDEMAEQAGNDGLSYRLAMLQSAPLLARCLANVASLGGWGGGILGSAQGIACHSMRDSHIALLATARPGRNGLRVEKLAAVVDCGRIVNPAIARQQIEGGLIFGLAAAVGATSDYRDNIATARKLRQLGLPLLRHCPDITLEFIRSNRAPGGIGELAVPVVAPAIANALYTITGRRIRSLPLSENLP